MELTLDDADIIEFVDRVVQPVPEVRDSIIDAYLREAARYEPIVHNPPFDEARHLLTDWDDWDDNYTE